jgi:twitching motility protein PilT
VVSLEELVQQLVERGGSDLHLSAGSPPMMRINGRLVGTDSEVLDPETSKKLIYSILDNEQIRQFEKEQELDMGFGISGLGRFRTNVLYQRGSVGAVLRVIPDRIPAMEQLGLPAEVLEQICMKKSGLVLVTGATGSTATRTASSPSVRWGPTPPPS